MPTWQAVHEGTQNWEWSWKGTFASPSGRMPPASSADAEDEAKKAAETGTLHTSSPGGRLPVALEWGGGSLLEEEEEWLVPAGGNRGGSTRHHGGRRGRLCLWKPVWIGGKQARLEMSSVLLMTAAKTPDHHRT